VASDSSNKATFGDYLKSWPLYLLPHHLLSRLILRATRWTYGPWKNGLIRWFLKSYKVDVSEALEESPYAYNDFNSFFARALHPDARPVNRSPGCICSPADSTVSQIGGIDAGRIIQAKGKQYSVVELLGGDPQRAAPFVNGSFTTLYLSPKDYHRVHMPYSGRLTETVYIPGRLFSVAPHTTRTIPNLFSRNERLVSIYETDIGPMAVILIGAIFVACIETVWEGVVTPPHGNQIRVQRYLMGAEESIHLEIGDELGRFNMGSTVILLFGPGQMAWQEFLTQDATVQMGQPIGQSLSAAP